MWKMTMEVLKLYGTVNYFIEQLQATIMNRLIKEKELSLKESYNKFKNEITKLNESEEVKEACLVNLNKAYEIVNALVAGRQEEEHFGIQVY